MEERLLPFPPVAPVHQFSQYWHFPNNENSKRFAKEYFGKLQKRNNLPKFLFMTRGKIMQKTWFACSLAFWLIWICQFPLNHWIALHTSWWDCVSSGNIITWSNRCDICIQPGSCKTMENSPQPRWHSWLTTKISRLTTIFERSSSIIWCRCWFSRWSCPCLSFPPTGPMHTDH